MTAPAKRKPGRPSKGPSMPVPVRVPLDLLRRIDEARGPLERGTWVLQACERALGDSVEQRLARVLECARREGLSPEDLAAALEDL